MGKLFQYNLSCQILIRNQIKIDQTHASAERNQSVFVFPSHSELYLVNGSQHSWVLRENIIDLVRLSLINVDVSFHSWVLQKY